MGGNLLTNNPFAILTFIAAPAILTNATSVLAMSTINRMLRTRDRMHELLKESADPATAQEPKFVEKADRVEQQAKLLLSLIALDLCRAGRLRRGESGDAARSVVRRVGP